MSIDLITTYAAACGLKIARPNVKEQFYPLGVDSYITIQTGSGQQLKNYDLWNDCLRLLAPFLEKAKLQVVHLGAAGDAPLPGTKSLCGKTNLRQSLYVLRRSRLHIGNDSWQAHMAAEAGVPLVALYGTTDAKIHGPHWKDDSKTILLESHRCGNRPSFGSNEPLKTINLIPPEDVVNSVLKLLKIDAKAPINQTIYIGPYYGQNMFEVIPDMVLDPQLYPDIPATVRMDYLFNEDNLLKQAQNRKIHLFMNSPIKLDIIKAIFPNILGLNYEVALDTDFSYLKSLKALGGRQIYYSKETNQKTLDDIRFKFFDIAPVEFVETKTKAKFLEESAIYLNKKLDELPKTLYYTSSKLLFAGGKTYLSIADWKEGKHVNTLENPIQQLTDSPDLWVDYPHYHVYT